MALIITEAKPPSVRQRKYKDLEFEDSLKEGQKFELLIGGKLYNEDLSVRIYADNNPFESKTETIRTWDIDAISSKNKKMFHVEAKDFARTYKFNTTGLPKRYVNDILLTAPSEYVIVVFRDNMELVEAKAKFQNRSVQNLLVEMQAQGFVRVDDKKVEFVPYGNVLKTLMLKACRDPESEKVCKCRNMWKYRGEDQYMWHLNAMFPWPDLVSHIFNNPKYPFDDTEKVLSKELQELRDIKEKFEAVKSLMEPING
tara:strand:- start:47588 stop:48355 length:768 start_codon:yes stop_codon:yes gene_type:complete